MRSRPGTLSRSLSTVSSVGPFLTDMMMSIPTAAATIRSDQTGGGYGMWPCIPYLKGLCGRGCSHWGAAPTTSSCRYPRIEISDIDDAIPCILEPQGNEKAFRKSWARLTQKIGACPGEGRDSKSLGLPKCQSYMRIISSIEDPSVIRDILKYLGIWFVRSRLPPKAHAPQIREYAAVDLQLQTHADTSYGDPEYTRVTSRALQGRPGLHKIKDL